MKSRSIRLYNLLYTFLVLLLLTWSNQTFAQDGVLELEETEVKSSIPEAPDLSAVRALQNPDKAIDITLDESFIPKIISSMKQAPF